MAASPSPLQVFEQSLSTVIRLLEEREGEVALRCGHDLPPASWSLLEHLHARGTLRVSQIAACLGVDISSITPRLKALEGSGLIARRRDPSDGRVHLIAITETGSRAVHGLHRARCELLEGLTGDLAPGQIADAAAVLAHVARRLDGQQPHA